MSILPLIAASLIAPNTPDVADAAPAWLTPAPLFGASATIEPLASAAQDDERRNGNASRGFYLRATGGLVTTAKSDGPGEEIDFDEGYLLAVALGKRFGANDSGLGFALELEGIWDDQDVSDSGTLQAVRDLTVAGALLNGVLDFPLSDRLSIYAGAGIGVAWLDAGTTSDSVNDFDAEDGPFLAWQGRGGLTWSFSSNTALQFGYRFLNIDDAEVEDGIGTSSFELQTQQHVLEIGLIFGF